MIRIVYNHFLISILCLVPAVVSAHAQRSVEGTWQGRLPVGGTSLRLVVHITDENGALSALMDSPDQGVRGIPVSTVAMRNDSVLFSVAGIQGSYAGRIDNSGDTITGVWTQGPASLPLVLARTTAVEQLRRPQEPKPPYPYQVEEVQFTNTTDDVTLSGTLTLPRTGTKHPAVILISGSGPQDRNEEIMGHKPFLVLADYLTRRGIAVLRFDERGVGRSTGIFATATTVNFAADVHAAVDFLNSRSDIDNSLIGLIGHSEGGLVAPMVATRSEDIAFLVLLAAPGLSGEEILYSQAELIARAGGMSEEMIAANRRLQQRLYGAVHAAADSAGLQSRIERIFADATDPEKELIRRSGLTAAQQAAVLGSPWLRFFLTYDPAPVLQRVDVPVLAVAGGRDLQVPPEANTEAIADALRSGGNSDVTIRILPGLNHLLQTATTGMPTEYGTIEETIAPQALQLIGSWITEHVQRK